MKWFQARLACRDNLPTGFLLVTRRFGTRGKGRLSICTSQASSRLDAVRLASRWSMIGVADLFVVRSYVGGLGAGRVSAGERQQSKVLATCRGPDWGGKPVRRIPNRAEATRQQVRIGEMQTAEMPN